MNFFSILFICLLLPGWSALSQPAFVPAAPYPVEVKQPDGSKLEIIGAGDEHRHISTTRDGYTVLKNPVGIYEFARLDAEGKLVPSGIRAQEAALRGEQETRFLRSVPKFLKGSQSTTSLKSAVSTTETLKSFPASGTKKTLLLLIEYPDLAHQHTTGEFDDMMNKKGYNGTGSFHDYFYQASGGILSLSVDVFGWYMAENTYEYYGDKNGDDRARKLVVEAIEAAHAAGVNFSKYDNNGDGVVDNLMVAHSGPGAEEGGRTEYIWSHSWGLNHLSKTYDGVKIDPYIIQPETRSYGMVNIGVYCHEFGHALGLPDLYDTNNGDGQSEGLGYWCLMASGSWLNLERTPAMMSAWVREELGWINPVVISKDGEYELSPAATGTACYKMPTSESNEYFLLENRYKTGFDAALPGSGLAIFHVNTSQFNNDDETLKLTDLEEADGQDHLDKNTNRGDGGDVFPGTSANTLFDDLSYPGSRLYNGQPSNITVRNIQLDGSVLRFTSGKEVIEGVDLTFQPPANSLSTARNYIESGIQVTNAGNQASGAFDVGWYLSADQNITTSDLFIGAHSVSGLGAGSSKDIQFTKDLTEVVPAIPEGTYYAGYILDYKDDVAEAWEDNNVYVFSSPQVEVTYKPELTYISANNNLVIQDFEVNLQMTVKNQGEKASGSFAIGIFISENTPVRTRDYFLGEKNISDLAAGAQQDISFTALVDEKLPNLPRGNYYVGYIIDYSGEAAEYDEGNNDYTFTGPQIDNTLDPNLYAATEGNSLVISSTQIEISGQVGNNGETVSPEGEVGFYLSADQEITPSDLLLGTAVLGRIEKEAVTPVSFTAELTGLEGRLDEGYYYAGYYIDPEDEITELDEQDNAFIFADSPFHYCPPDVTVFTEEICQGDSLVFEGEVIKTAGMHEFNYVGVNGCDSVIVLDLIVHPSHEVYLNRTICLGDSVRAGGIYYKESGVFTHVLENSYGCDSLVILDLQVMEPVETVLEKQICDGDSVEVAGFDYFESGVYTHLLTSQWGCDSLVILDLMVNQPSETFLTRMTCDGDSVMVGDRTFKTTGIFETTLTNRWGCDSLVTLDLTINSADEIFLEETVCQGDSVWVGPHVYKRSGTFFHTFSNRNGCDSVVTLQLRVIEPPRVDLGEDIVLFSSEEAELDAGAGYVHYTWSTGDETQVLPVNKSAGLGTRRYEVTVTNELGCTASDEIEITIYHDADPVYDTSPLLRIFPNPGNGTANLMIAEVMGEYQLVVSSKTGAVVFQKTFQSPGKKFVQELDLSFLPPGMYLVQVLSNGKRLVDKYILERN